MNSSQKIINCFQGAARDLGLKELSPNEIVRTIGLSLNDAWLTLLEENDLHLINQLIGQYRLHWIERDQTAMEYFEGVEEGLSLLDKKGFMLAVATGKSRAGLDRVLNESSLLNLFVTTRCADESFSKPHPQMLLDILDFTGLEKEQALMIGDTTFDMKMANNASMDSAGVSYGSHSVDELSKLSTAPVFHSFNEFVTWVSQ